MDIANIALDIAFTDLFLYLLLFSSLYIEFLTTKVFTNFKFIFCFDWSYKNILLFWVMTQKKLLTNQFAVFSTFDLFDLLILIPRVHCSIVFLWLMYLISLSNFRILLCLMKTNSCVPFTKYTIHQNLLHIYNLCQWVNINSIYSIWH